MVQQLKTTFQYEGIGSTPVRRVNAICHRATATEPLHPWSPYTMTRKQSMNCDKDPACCNLDQKLNKYFKKSNWNL